MNPPKNVQIPYSVFISLLDTLEYIDLSNYAADFRTQFESVLEALRNKKRQLERREDYSRLIAANKTGDEDKKHEARIQYLSKRNHENTQKQPPKGRAY